MLNHARNLLANLKPGDTGVPGEEYIPSKFRPKALPTYMQQLRFRLFGVDPDRAMVNYRCKQFLTLLHVTKLEEFITDLDPRITYLADDTELYLESNYTPRVSQVSGTAAPLSILGSPAGPDAQGRMFYDYAVDVLTSSSVKVIRRSPPAQEVTSSFSLTGGLSDPVTLPGSGYQFKLATNATDVSYRISGYLRPQWALSTIELQLRRIGEPVLNQLFGISSVAPYSTFKELWENHPELPYSLGGLLLAFIYRMDELNVA